MSARFSPYLFVSNTYFLLIDQKKPFVYNPPMTSTDRYKKTEKLDLYGLKTHFAKVSV